MVYIFSEELGMELSFMNIYVPCHKCEKLWENLMRSSFMLANNIIIRGDLNFSIGHAES